MGLGGGGSGGGGGGGGGTEFSDWFTRFWSSSTAQRAHGQKRAERGNLTPFVLVKEENMTSLKTELFFSKAK